MVEVEIRGKFFPLCLTVAALDEVNAKCGGLKNLMPFLRCADEEGNVHVEQMAVNTAWMLGVLIREGEENRVMVARFENGDTKKRAVPGKDDIWHLMTPSEIVRYRPAIMEAISQSMGQEVEVEPPKNPEHAAQR